MRSTMARRISEPTTLACSARPFLVQFDDALRVPPPDQSVGGGNDRHGHVGQLLDRVEYRFAEQRNDVDVVPQRLPLVEGTVGALIIEDAAPEGAVPTKRIAGEQDLLLSFVRHHRLRPVDEWGGYELQRMGPQRECLPVLDHPDAI